MPRLPKHYLWDLYPTDESNETTGFGKRTIWRDRLQQDVGDGENTLAAQRVAGTHTQSSITPAVASISPQAVEE